jgi:transposase
MHPSPRPVLPPDVRSLLSSNAHSPTSQARLVERSRIILLAAEGLSDTAVAAKVGCTRQKVGKWVKRFLAEGPECLGRDREGRGRKRTTMTQAKVQEIVDLTRLEKPPAQTHWTLRSMAARAGVSPSAVHAVWSSHNLQPHRTTGWKLSLDRDFSGKLADVVGLYLNPPDNAVVFSIDEKSQIQALERSQPVQGVQPGRPERRTHDYKRHGTTTLFSALNTVTGKVLGKCYPRHRHEEFIDFLAGVEATVPEGMELHVIVDNYATHKHANVKAWLEKNPRVTLHFTPTSCSWVNMIERFFSELTTKRIRRDSFRSVAELEAAIEEYLQHHNEHGKPYVWKKTFEQIVRAINRSYVDSESGH